MTHSQYKLLLGSSATSLILALLLVVLGFYRAHLESGVVAQQEALAKVQADVNRGMVSLRTANSIVQDLAQISANKPEVQALLARYGVTVKHNSPSAP